jgi:hypothetical protein
MMRTSIAGRSSLFRIFGTLAVLILAGCAAGALQPKPDMAKLEAAGFKILLAQTQLQQERVQRLAPGKFTMVQRTGLHFYIYPDAPQNRIFLGTPKEFEAWQKLQPGYAVNPQAQLDAQQAKDMSSYAKQNNAMTAASQREASDPYLYFNWPTLDELNW